LPEGISDAELAQRLLQPANSSPPPDPAKPLPDWHVVHEQLRRKGVTLQLLWAEYRQAHPEGYQRSQFCQLYRDWAKKLDPVLRQVHSPGQKLFVDWAGLKVPIHAADGSVSEASLFVAVLGFSNKTYVEAFANEQLEHWIAGHCRAFNFYGGLTRALVPDNCKTAVVRPCRYEPVLHRSYQEMASHYGTVILPARVKKPRDKAKVETGVQIAERQILAPLRDQRFFSVAELNQALRPLLDKLNAQEFQKLEGSRNGWFEAQEKPTLLPLPAQPFWSGRPGGSSNGRARRARNAPGSSSKSCKTGRTLKWAFAPAWALFVWARACALAHQACRDGHRVGYYYAPKLFRELQNAQADGSLLKLLKKLNRAALIVIDDFGVAAVAGKQYRDLLEILDDRQGTGSTLITSQFPVDQWHEVINDATVADAILDRLVHNAYRLELNGESLRKTRANLNPNSQPPAD
jgi:transposase